ncbi:zinc ribbon domain-containing protein [Flavobacterium sp. DGU11]|uniref:Zinc ribbon domain-containing protein n=1 Tax=Flavobacterium arundinis TaxID=3139143 RepID=A0ABU9HS58_9FLAO
MEKCIRCDAALEPGTNFCPVCGTDQRFVYRPEATTITLKVLCILTIVGSVFQLFRGLIYEMVANDSNNNEYIRGWIYGITGVMTLAGAVMMLQKQLNGLYLYTVGQIIYLLTCFWATSVYMEEAGDATGLLLTIAAVFVVPAILFLIVFWTDECKKGLR